MSLLRHLLTSPPMSAGIVLDAYRKSHEIDGSSEGEQTDYQVQIRVFYKSDGLDHVTHIGDYEGSNPIITGANAREPGNVLQDPTDTGKEYKTYWSELNRIQYAYSTDGKTWTDHGEVIGLTHEDPYVLKVGATYYMYLEEKGTGTNRITRLDSADGETWANETVVLEKTGAGFERDHVSSPVVWKEGATWYMIYEGLKVNAATIGKIGLATSADGLSWDRYVGNPILEGTVGEWDEDTVVSGDVVKVNGTYYLFYYGLSDVVYKTGIAHSTDLHSWTKHDENPIVYPEVTASPEGAVNVVHMYWNDAEEKWVAHYCDNYRAAEGAGLTNGIYRGYPKDTGDMFVCVDEKCRTDFGDVRFRQGVTELDYWLKEKVDGEYAIFWVKIPTIPVDPGSVTIHVYYGKADATTTSDPDAALVDYDNFDNNVIDAKWTELTDDGGDWAEQNEQMEGDGLGDAGFIITLKNDETGTDMSINVKINFRTTYPLQLTGEISFEITDYDTYYALKGAPTPGDNWSIGERGAAGGWTLRATKAEVVNVDQWYDVEIRLFGGECTVIVDDDVKCSYDWGGDFTKEIGLSLKKAATDYDDWWVRKYVDPEPTHGAWGAEEAVVWPF